jgi:hypothetical protein
MTARYNDDMINELGAFFVTREEYAQIAQSTLTGSVASVTFSGIPSYFRTLKLVCQLRSDRTAENDAIGVRFNGDSGNNYDYIQMQARAAGMFVAISRATSSMRGGICEAANSRSNNFSPALFTIPAYSLTGREKWLCAFHSSAMGNVSADTDVFVEHTSGRWRNTASITSVTIFPLLGTNWVSGNIFQLYGIA